MLQIVLLKNGIIAGKNFPITIETSIRLTFDCKTYRIRRDDGEDFILPLQTYLDKEGNRYIMGYSEKDDILVFHVPTLEATRITNDA